MNTHTHYQTKYTHFLTTYTSTLYTCTHSCPLILAHPHSLNKQMLPQAVHSAMVLPAEPETPPITPEGGGGREGKKKGEGGPERASDS